MDRNAQPKRKDNRLVNVYSVASRFTGNCQEDIVNDTRPCREAYHFLWSNNKREKLMKVCRDGIKYHVP